MTISHFYTTADFPQKEIVELIKLALMLKKGQTTASLTGKTLVMLFFNPSLRTRVSFAVAMQKLDGLAIDTPVDQIYPLEFKDGVVMDGVPIEHIKETARVLSGYSDTIAVRASNLITQAAESVAVDSWQEVKKDKVIKGFMKHAVVPIINMESNVYHPCQGLADAMTLTEKLGKPKGKKCVFTWVYHPKALPMATINSQILAACDLGMQVVVAYPKRWDLDQEIVEVMRQRSREAGGSLEFTNSMEEAIRGGDVVCAKSWGALPFYGNWKDEKKLRDKLKHWIVDREKMDLTNNAFFMHCLPVRRNVEVTDEVLDSQNSVVVNQAENRVWAQMAILRSIMGVRS